MEHGAWSMVLPVLGGLSRLIHFTSLTREISASLNIGHGALPGTQGYYREAVFHRVQGRQDFGFGGDIRHFKQEPFYFGCFLHTH